MSFLYTYVFRGIGVVLALAMMTIFWLACNQRINRTQEERARDEAKRTLDAMHKDASEKMLKYSTGQMQRPPEKKEQPKEKSK